MIHRFTCVLVNFVFACAVTGFLLHASEIPSLQHSLQHSGVELRIGLLESYSGEGDYEIINIEGNDRRLVADGAHFPDRSSDTILGNLGWGTWNALKGLGRFAFGVFTQRDYNPEDFEGESQELDGYQSLETPPGSLTPESTILGSITPESLTPGSTILGSITPSSAPMVHPPAWLREFFEICFSDEYDPESALQDVTNLLPITVSAISPPLSSLPSLPSLPSPSSSFLVSDTAEEAPSTPSPTSSPISPPTTSTSTSSPTPTPAFPPTSPDLIESVQELRSRVDSTDKLTRNFNELLKMLQKNPEKAGQYELLAMGVKDAISHALPTNPSFERTWKNLGCWVRDLVLFGLTVNSLYSLMEFLGLQYVFFSPKLFYSTPLSHFMGWSQLLTMLPIALNTWRELKYYFGYYLYKPYKKKTLLNYLGWITPILMLFPLGAIYYTQGLEFIKKSVQINNIPWSKKRIRKEAIVSVIPTVLAFLLYKCRIIDMSWFHRGKTKTIRQKRAEILAKLTSFQHYISTLDSNHDEKKIISYYKTFKKLQLSSFRAGETINLSKIAETGFVVRELLARQNPHKSKSRDVVGAITSIIAILSVYGNVRLLQVSMKSLLSGIELYLGSSTYDLFIIAVAVLMGLPKTIVFSMYFRSFCISIYDLLTRGFNENHAIFDWRKLRIIASLGSIYCGLIYAGNFALETYFSLKEDNASLLDMIVPIIGVSISTFITGTSLANYGMAKLFKAFPVANNVKRVKTVLTEMIEGLKQSVREYKDSVIVAL